VSGFKRGSELYGGFASRLEEPSIKESLAENGLVVVEGMNDVIRLDELGICSVGILATRRPSNKSKCWPNSQIKSPKADCRSSPIKTPVSKTFFGHSINANYRYPSHFRQD